MSIMVVYRVSTFILMQFILYDLVERKSLREGSRRSEGQGFCKDDEYGSSQRDGIFLDRHLAVTE